MSRKVFDILASGVGLILVVVLLVAGGLLAWGASYANSTVHNQLAMQQIYFPPQAAFANAKPGTEITPAMRGTIEKYAGQQVLTGAQAEAYANDFIRIHLSEMPYGGVYAKVSAASMASPTNASLAALVQTSFRGTTLRAMLLEAYGFSMLGTVAFYSSIAAFCLAFLLFIASGLGIWHARQTEPDRALLARRATKGTAVPA